MKTVFKCTLILLMLALLLTLAGCQPNAQSGYENAQFYLGAKEYILAADIFSSLGGYQDAEKYVLYCKALDALEKGDYARARQDFCNLDDFELSYLYYDYVSACQAEMEGDLYEAQETYMLLGSFLDSRQKYDALAVTIPEQSYATAKTLFDIGEYEKALAAFLALDTYRDSAAMARLASDAMGAKNLQKIEDLFIQNRFDEAFNELAAFSSTASQTLKRDAEALQKKYEAKATASPSPSPTGIAPAVANAAATTYAVFGTYQNAPLVFQVLSRTENSILLLADEIIDILPVNQTGEIFAGYENSSLRTFMNGEFLSAFSPSEKAAIISIALPDVALAKSLAPQTLMAAVSTRIKDKDPLTSSLGNGVWWLSDKGTLANSLAIVYYNGVVYEKGLPATDLRTGIRPLITVNTALFPFAKGTGTKEDPLQ